MTGEPASSGPSLRLTLPARAENVAVVRQALNGVAEGLALEAFTLTDIKIAVSEACTNVVLHAYPDQEGLLLVDAWADGAEELVVVVRDRGSGFTPAPRTESAGLGLGLALIASLSREVQIGSEPGGGTEVSMRFRLEPDREDLELTPL
jgi:anti-sigma regulatory factor (Ser/Thr protein kinase)